jgi:hypothetical protein
MLQICGMLKNPSFGMEHGTRQMTAKFAGQFLSIILSFTNRVSHVAWRGVPLEMTGRTTKAVHKGPAAFRPRCYRVVAP